MGALSVCTPIIQNIIRTCGTSDMAKNHDAKAVRCFSVLVSVLFHIYIISEAHQPSLSSRLGTQTRGERERVFIRSADTTPRASGEAFDKSNNPVVLNVRMEVLPWERQGGGREGGTDAFEQ